MCLCVGTCMWVQVSEEARIGCWIPSNWSYREFRATWHRCGTKLGSSARQASALNCRPVFPGSGLIPTPHFNLWFISDVSARGSEDGIAFCFLQSSWLPHHHTWAAFIPLPGSRCYLYCMLALHLCWVLFLESIFPASLWCLQMIVSWFNDKSLKYGSIYGHPLFFKNCLTCLNFFLSQNDTQLVSNLKMGEMNSGFIEFMSGLLMGVPRKLNPSNNGHVFTFDPFDPTAFCHPSVHGCLFSWVLNISFKAYDSFSSF